MHGKTLSALAAGLFIVSALTGASGLLQDRFSDGSAGVLLTFPENGGSDTTVSVDLPRHVTVNSAFVDMEGRGRSFGSSAGSIDFSNPGSSSVFGGTLSQLPPSGKPNGYEGNNITLDRGFQRSDDMRTPAKAANSVPYHMFEFDLSETSPTDFDFMWEGIGNIYPSSGSETSTALLFLYNCATGKWDNMDSYDLGGPAKTDQFLWARVSSGAPGYLDGRGYACLMVTVPLPMIGQYTGYIETDYAALWYNGTRNLYPENVKLDVRNDGSVEWQHPGKLRGKVNFTGDAFVSAVQAALDASSQATVKVPFKFSSDKGGYLFVSNLSIVYDLKNLPPEVNGTLPALEMPEDTNATPLADLRDCFKDDAGTKALEFAVVYEEDSTKLDAALNADGHSLDLFTMTPNWYGQLGFRVRATDAEGLFAEAPLTVKVLSVNDPPKLKSTGTLIASQEVRFERTFSATDADIGMDPDEVLSFSTNSTYLTLEPDTGVAYFTPSNSQVGTHLFNLTVTDRQGASDTRNLTLKVDNQNDPPSIEEIPDQTATEDEPFLLQVSASDPDLEVGLDELTFEDDTPLFTIAPNGTVSFTPAEKDVGEHAVTISVRDAAGARDSRSFILTVLNVNDPPKLQAVADQTIEEDELLAFRIMAMDEDAGDVLGFADNSSLFNINATGWVSFRPAQKDVGVHPVNVTVTDGAGASASVLFRITVVNVNDPPREVRILGPGNGSSFRQGEEVAFSGNATDDDGDALNFTWYSGDTVIGTGPSFKTKLLRGGTHAITLRVSDGSVEVPSPPLELTVKKKAPAPSKGFIPGFTLLGLLAAGAAGLLAGASVRRKGRQDG